jgi:hypothetical protein
MNIHDETILIKLFGSNPKSIDSWAKVSSSKAFDVYKHKWYLGKDGYPYSFINGSRVPLHRFIWWINTKIWSNNTIKSDGSIGKLYIDHINRDKLDATDSNLRLSTPAENSYNKTLKITKSSIIDPITNEPLHHIKLLKSGYSISLSKNGKTNTICKIQNLNEAKEIYNMMAHELFGEYAVLY